MTPDEVVTLLMDAVDIHDTVGCFPSLVSLTELKQASELIEAGCVLTDRICAHLRDSGRENASFSVHGLPQTSGRQPELAQLLADTLASGIVAGRDAVAPRWARVDLELQSMAVATLFHVSIELGAWTRASEIS